MVLVLFVLIAAAVLPTVILVGFLMKTVLAIAPGAPLERAERRRTARANVLKLAAARIAVALLAGSGSVVLMALASGETPAAFAERHTGAFVLAWIVGSLVVSPVKRALRKRITDVVMLAAVDDVARSFGGVPQGAGVQLGADEERHPSDIEGRVVRDEPPPP